MSLLIRKLGLAHASAYDGLGGNRRPSDSRIGDEARLVCGICGEIAFNGKPASTSTVREMTSVLHRRGPDSQGLFWQQAAALGHCRLKIIDLSDAAAQPMIDPTLGLTLVYNGMIYNYRELREQLEAKGHRFFSRGDSEVVLKAYAQWGSRCVERFNGMFAFVISERDTGRTFLARDRLGIKPLYYAKTTNHLRFASSLPALLKAGGVDTTIDPVALHHYMTFHAVVPAPYTILRGVRKLPPATTMLVEPDGRQSQHRYWEPIFNASPDEARYSFDDWKSRLFEALSLAINRRMIADVPVGVLLSGGLDSSLVVGMLARAGQKNLNTFSIGFESVGGEAGDEFKYSDIIAERFDTHHHKIQVESSETLPAMQDCVRAMSEPMVSHDAIGFYLLSQEVSKHVKVVQSGQGADEVFAGYHWYPPMMDVAAAANADDALTAYAAAFFDRDHEEYTHAVAPALVDQDFSRAFVREHFGADGADRPIDQSLRLDTTVMLVDDPVKRVDNMTMAWGLEARVPFLDHELVELAARIPAEHKVGSIESWEKTGGKHVLKEVARSVIPAQVIDRPKGYFPVPALKYLRGPYLTFVRDILEQPAARKRTLFNRDYINTLLAEPQEHITPLRGSKLWQVALLEYWLQVHEVSE